MTVQATFVATLVDEWVRGGVRHAVISPGSRSSALTVGLATDARITVHMRLDERSAGFFAIGIAKSSKSPVVVVTTSGTASSELHAAVVEADLGAVPMIVATTDRPIELHGVGASQTINQEGLFGSSTRLAVNFGVAEVATEHLWRSMASSLVATCLASPNGPGPVQANIAFREPFVGVEVGPLPPGRPDGAPWHRGHLAKALSHDDVAALCAALSGKSGIIVAGEGSTEDGDPSDILALSDQLSWPVIADPRSFPRTIDARVVSYADGIFRSELAKATLRPQVILRLGVAHLSKSFATFLASLRGSDVHDIAVNRYGVIADPDRMANDYFSGEPSAIIRQCVTYMQNTDRQALPDLEWRALFTAADVAAGRAIDEFLEGESERNEPSVLRDVFAAVPPKATVVVAASMPTRDLEWFAAPRSDAPRIVFNGGVNGIEGSVSTVLGVAVGCAQNEKFSPPVTAIMGDLSFFHDLSGLVWGDLEQVPSATIVVIDNRGGGIFSFLDQKRVLDDSLYERVMATPQRSDPVQVARSLGCNVVEGGDESLATLLNASYQQNGISVIVVRTDRDENLALHSALNRAVVAGVEAALFKVN